MQFYSLTFLLFVTISFSLFYITKKNYRLLGLLILSYIFYSMFSLKHLLVLIFVTGLNFFCAKYINLSETEKRKKRILIVTIIFNIIILFLFKYLSFAIENINYIIKIFNFGIIIPDYSISLPLGLSFYIFATLGYVIDVYRKNSSTTNLLSFSVFSSFFPLIQSGPIERSNNFLNQINKETSFRYDNAKEGLYLVFSGLFKKYVIADRLSIIVNPILDDYNSYGSLFLTIAFITFAFQIYYDFSGYSDIAIGIARLFGYDIKKNFNYPYTAKSISEFWKKWHITLSEWLRDYIFLPIAYYTSRKYINSRIIKPENISYYSAVFITMLVTGIWHGASWNYIIWGLIFAVTMITTQVTKKLRKKIIRNLSLNKYPRIFNFAKVLNTFAIVCFAWIFFRTNTLYDSIEVIGIIFNSNILLPQVLADNYYLLVRKVPFLTIILSYSFLLAFEIILFFERRIRLYDKIMEYHLVVRWLIYTFVVSLLLFLSVVGDTKFIYFKY